MVDLSRELKETAATLGFITVGITPAAPLPRTKLFLDELKQAGQRTPFTTNDTRRRTDPGSIWPGAKSLLMVGWPYKVPATGPRPSGELRGYFAAGTLGQDYHDLLSERLTVLRSVIKQNIPGSRTVPFVDTSPLIERAYAYQAGLGVWGENTFIIRPYLAPTFFLGGLVTDVELKPDEPSNNTCLQCGLCRDACPTGALAKPYRLTYQRCLSYWTQAKQIMPVELRPLLGNRLYGCDSCLRACPLIKKSPREGATVDLQEFLVLSKKDFQTQYGTSSMSWRGQKVLQRNALLALGNSGQQQTVPLLCKFLVDGEPTVRAAAAWSLGQLGGKPAYTALQNRLKSEREPWVEDEIRHALQRIWI
ncbi:MAG: tRNA epoxyqueuosine(34) reductase QueG [Firmicutes bacterium]|nr:tRNA epoxyqueuosine(34) reductase QueG [Bacillota bacterium]